MHKSARRPLSKTLGIENMRDKMKENTKSESDVIYGHWSAVKAFAVIVFISVLAYKIVVIEVDFTFDFPTLLSLLLAFFSVGLAAMFYFKATESSNTFYDNTYKFTRDIAQLLTKIESGFGERLKHLDEGYASMRDHIQKMPTNPKVNEAKKRIEKEEEHLDKTVEERNAIINSFLDKTQIQDEEKQQFIEALKEKEEDLQSAHEEISKLKRKVLKERIRQKRSHSEGLLSDPPFRGYVNEHIVEKIGGERVKTMPPNIIRRRLESIKPELSKSFTSDLIENRIFDEDMDLTRKGYIFLKEIASEFSEE